MENKSVGVDAKSRPLLRELRGLLSNDDDSSSKYKYFIDQTAQNATDLMSYLMTFASDSSIVLKAFDRISWFRRGGIRASSFRGVSRNGPSW